MANVMIYARARKANVMIYAQARKANVMIYAQARVRIYPVATLTGKNPVATLTGKNPKTCFVSISTPGASQKLSLTASESSRHSAPA